MDKPEPKLDNKPLTEEEKDIVRKQREQKEQGERNIQSSQWWQDVKDEMRW